jgi:hypothetical protein
MLLSPYLVRKETVAMLTTQILATVEPMRLLKATEGLVSGAYTITVLAQSEAEIRGFVKNGDGIEYAVELTPARAFCSCKDAMFRHTTCKHAVALALYAIRHPQTGAKPQEEPTEPPAGWIGETWNLTLTRTRPGFAFSA